MHKQQILNRIWNKHMDAQIGQKRMQESSYNFNR